MKKRLIAIILALVLVFALCACSGGENKNDEKILRLGESFAYASLDPHKDYNSWGTSAYGLTEALFKMNDRSVMEPLLAEKAEVSEDGLTWTVTLKDGVCFSNGNAVTAEMVIRNIERLAEVNERFAYLADFEYKATSDAVFTITTPEVYPTMLNELATPELAILDLDASKDIDNAPVATGPFVVKSFVPESTVEVSRNENYWGGDVKLDGAVFYYMPDDESKLMAMQNGEIDGYAGVSAASAEIFSADPDRYVLTDVAATRLQFYILNENRMSDEVRKAINLTVDCDAIAEYLSGTVSPAVGPFGENTAYGKVIKPAADTAAAKKTLEDAGYTLNSDGIYEKGGKPLSLKICYYPSRSLDSIAVIMQQQLKAVGIASTVESYEDPDGTYIATGDFDIALYCMIADKNGDPFYFIDCTLRSGAPYNCGGFESTECNALIAQLRYETDADKRSELANKIVQIAIDDNAFGYVGLFNKISVTAPGVTGIAENCPFDFYRIDADTDIVR